jgi:hypothetical protein
MTSFYEIKNSLETFSESAYGTRADGDEKQHSYPKGFCEAQR